MKVDCAFCDNNKCAALTKSKCGDKCTFFETKEDFGLRQRSFEGKQSQRENK